MSDPAGRFLRIRPLALLGVSGAIGCLFGAYSNVPALVWGIFTALCAIAFAVRRNGIFLMLAVLFSFSVTAHAALADPALTTTDSARIRGIVTGEVVQKENHSLAVLRNVTTDGKKLGTKIRVSIYDKDISVTAGDVLTYTGRTYRPNEKTNPGEFDYALWLKRRGIRLCSSCSASSEVEVEKGFAWDTVPMRIRAFVTRRIDEAFGETAPLARAIVLSDKSEMEEDVYDAFRRAGLAHLMAVSGLHISCLAAAVELLLRRLLGMKRHWALAVTTALLLLYGAMIGFPASVVRASVMYVALAAAPLAGRPGDTLTNISLAALLLLLAQPLFITDTGFQLSFLAVTGVVCASHYVHVEGFLGKILSLLAVGFGASLATLPVVACAYGSISLLAPVTGIFAIPAVSLALPLSVAAVFTWKIPLLGTAFAFAARGLLQTVTALSRYASSLPLCATRMPPWPGGLMAAYALLALCLMPHFDLKRHARVAALGGMLLCALACFPLARSRVPEGVCMDFLDAGQADAAVLTANRHTYLIDTGTSSTPADEFLRYSDRTVDALFLTHPDADHAGGIGAVRGVDEPNTIYVPCTWDDFPHDPEVDEALQGRTTVPLAKGDTVALAGGVLLRVLQPESGKKYADSNAASLVLLAQYGDASVLLTGDAYIEDEGTLPDADLLKVAHHGSPKNTSAVTADGVTPSVSVISVGRNSYGHPAREVITALTDAGSAVYRTDECGLIHVSILSDGTLGVTTTKQAEGERQ